MKTSLRRGIGKRGVVAALASLLPLAFAAPVQAASDTLDQSVVLNLWLGAQSSVPYLAQTFTAGVTGQVDRVSLREYTPTGFAGFTVSLRSVDANGVPTATVLGSSPTVIGFVPCCQFRDFGFAPAVPVTKGTKYAIVVQVMMGNVAWQDSGFTVPYSGGRQYIGGSATSWMTTTHGDFGFEEWVVTNVNQPPVVGADSAALSVPEGGSAANTGTCSDPDGDTVALSASDGTVSACTAGKWTWSKAAGDESPTETVTITADDGHGATASTSFTLDVAAEPPTAQIVSDPASITVPEGTSVPLTGTATSPSAADNTAGFAYTWTVTDGGAPYAGGTGSSFSFVPKDDGSYLVVFNATDDGGMVGSTSLAVIATNVAPTAKIDAVASTEPLVTTAFESLSFSGSYTDVDTNDHYSITWSFGDGSTASGLDVTHSYSKAGTYNVTFTVSDGEGGVGSASTKVTIQTTQQALSSIEAYVQSLPGLSAGERNSLMVKLQNASDAAQRGDNNAASNELNAFLNELQADVNSGQVSPSAASTLRSAVHAVQSTLGTFNRLVEWWPLEA